jgi:hypothetical protein
LWSCGPYKTDKPRDIRPRDEIGTTHPGITIYGPNVHSQADYIGTPVETTSASATEIREQVGTSISTGTIPTPSGNGGASGQLINPLVGRPQPTDNCNDVELDLWLIANRGASFACVTGRSEGRPHSKAVTPWERYPPNRGFLAKPVRSTLDPGTRISRYGSEEGTFASPENVPFSERGLPSEALNSPYAVYEVAQRVEVDGGVAQYWMGSGGGIQYEFQKSIGDLIAEGKIKRVKPR